MANTTSAKVKNRWNAAHYDRITVLVQKGEKEKLSKIAEQEGTTVARLFVDALNAQRPGLLTTLDKTLPSLHEKPQNEPEELPEVSDEETTESPEEPTEAPQNEAN